MRRENIPAENVVSVFEAVFRAGIRVLTQKVPGLQVEPEGCLEMLIPLVADAVCTKSPIYEAARNRGAIAPNISFVCSIEASVDQTNGIEPNFNVMAQLTSAKVICTYYDHSQSITGVNYNKLADDLFVLNPIPYCYKP